MLPFDSFVGFLNWLVGPGLPIVVGGTLSLLAWNIPQWEKLPKIVKSITPFALAIVYSYLGSFVLNTPDIVNSTDINFVFNTILFYYASQGQYGYLKGTI